MTKILAHCDFSMRFPVLMLQGNLMNSSSHQSSTSHHNLTNKLPITKIVI